MIAIIDYGMGNLRSVAKAFELFTDNVVITADPATLDESDAVVLPGDGAFGQAMENLDKLGWISPLKKYISDNRYFLGICLGYQLLFTSSEEFGFTGGLDIIPGRVIKFETGELKVPHMGWNHVRFLQESKFMKDIDSGSYFYFIHSYYPFMEDTDWQIGISEYGRSFPSIVGKNNIIATQFHPEKSHKSGLKIIENFVKAFISKK